MEFWLYPWIPTSHHPPCPFVTLGLTCRLSSGLISQSSFLVLGGNNFPTFRPELITLGAGEGKLPRAPKIRFSQPGKVEFLKQNPAEGEPEPFACGTKINSRIKPTCFEGMESWQGRKWREYMPHPFVWKCCISEYFLSHDFLGSAKGRVWKSQSMQMNSSRSHQNQCKKPSYFHPNQSQKPTQGRSKKRSSQLNFRLPQRGEGPNPISNPLSASSFLWRGRGGKLKKGPGSREKIGWRPFPRCPLMATFCLFWWAFGIFLKNTIHFELGTANEQHYLVQEITE